MYRLDFSDDGKASLASLDKNISQRVLDKLKWLIQNIESITPLPLRKNLAGLYKLRVGDFRVMYEINHDDKVITVHKVGHRREIYK
ncbi:MAG: type II toxin-antitoxin system RelE/ParE family toxin [Nitrospirae bacterium]|nr:type II toxin-antitoxin system RelE/ParE family toxin [Nitrospirota bacterium]